MRYLFAALCLCVLLAGLLFGALNPQLITVDLYFLGFETRLGAALLVSVLLGTLLGGICAAMALALQRRRRGRVERNGPSTALVNSVDNNAE